MFQWEKHICSNENIEGEQTRVNASIALHDF